MKGFRTGQYSPKKVSGFHRQFCPILAANHLEEVSLNDLAASGKKLILLDVDNTITKWKAEQIAEPVQNWINQAKELGFHLALLSNTRHPERLMRLAKLLDLTVIEGKMKPSRSMYQNALTHFNVRADEAVMIGDQLLTDVLGANRSQIEAIWLNPISETEFIGTKINRWFERRIMLGIFQALETSPFPEAADLPPTKGLSSPVLRQIFRFCLVGGVSFVIDAGISVILESFIKINGVRLSLIFGTWLQQEMPFVFGRFPHPEAAAASIFFWISALFAMANSFYFNRLWTFEITGSEQKYRQMRRFVVVTLLGTALNSAVSTQVFGHLTGGQAQRTAIAKAVAAVIVAAWNFLGQRYYAFRVTNHKEA